MRALSPRTEPQHDVWKTDSVRGSAAAAAHRPGRAALRVGAPQSSTAAPSGSSPISPAPWSTSAHDVTLFASGDADTRARLVPVRDEPIRLDAAPLKSDLASHLSMLHEVHRRRADFDIIHFHTDMLHFPLFDLCAARTVTTLHGRLDMKDLAGVYARWPDFPARLDLRQPAPSARRRELDQDHPSRRHAFRRHVRADRSGCGAPYLLFLGRISPEKTPGPGHRGRQGLRRHAEDRRQGRCRRPRLFSRGRSSRCWTIRSSSISARSARRRSRRCSAAPGRCSFRSTGPSRSASS